MIVHNEEGAELCHVQGGLHGLGSIREEETVLAAADAALEPNTSSLEIDKCAGLNQAESELTPDQTSEVSIYGSDSEDWGSLSSYSSDNNREEADSLIEISLPFHEGDHIGFSQWIRHKEDDALNDNEEDSLLELDISAGFIKANGEDEQSTSI
ncbi:hypothetical protein MLD38_002220 [Melastoma candidum]|nr:hypothetical protein MLD38_002220 [Melastoma candidum]